MAQTFGLHRDERLAGFRSKADAKKRLSAEARQGADQTPLRQIERLAFAGRENEDREDLAARHHREVPVGRGRKRVRARPRRLPMVEAPAHDPRVDVFEDHLQALEPQRFVVLLGFGDPEFGFDFEVMTKRARDHLVGVLFDQDLREFARSVKEHARLMFALVGGLGHVFAVGDQLSRDEPHDEHHRKGHDVLRVRHGKGPAGLDRRQVEDEDREDRGEGRGDAPEAHPAKEHAEKVDHRLVRGLHHVPEGREHQSARENGEHRLPDAGTSEVELGEPALPPRAELLPFLRVGENEDVQFGGRASKVTPPLIDRALARADDRDEREIVLARIARDRLAVSPGEHVASAA